MYHLHPVLKVFIECDICHITCKNVRDLGLHKKEHHSGLFKPKPRPGPVSSVSKTQSPVPHGNVQKTPIGSPVLLPRQIACPLCKISCNDKNVLMGHVSAEHSNTSSCVMSLIALRFTLVNLGCSNIRKHTRKWWKKQMTVYCVWIVNKHLNWKWIATITVVHLEQMTRKRKKSLHGSKC